MGTVSIVGRTWYPLGGGMVEKEFDLTGSSSYLNGTGDTFPADTSASLNTGIATGTAKVMPFINDLTKIRMFLVEPRFDGYTIRLDKTNKLVKVYDASGTEVVNTTNLTSKTWRCRIRYFDNGPFTSQ